MLTTDSGHNDRYVVTINGYQSRKINESKRKSSTPLREI